MALVGDPVSIGLDVIRIKLGENAYRFVMQFARKKKTSPGTSKKLDEVGALCGLNAREIATASSGTNKNTKFPLWLRFILIVVAFIASFIIVIWVYNATYLPGTLYASLSPKDFQNRLHHSSTLLPSVTM
ncbi:MAG: hypothetical protein P1Q69_08390 [Candidatus Thorarchaeota archaeon]|nr:hypothetical protein [Candidatus Thorarchaeota archaeon]